LATLATPSKKAFRSMTNFAARTAARTSATLGLTPCNFRSRSSARSRSSSVMMVLPSSSSTRLSCAAAGGATRSATATAVSGGVRMSSLSSSSKAVGGRATNGVLVKRPEKEEEEEEADDDDDVSKVTQKTYDPNDDEKDDDNNGGGAAAAAALLAAQKEEEEEAAAATANNEKKKMEDFLSKVQTAMDVKMKQFDEKLDEKFTKKKHEMNEFFERTAKTLKENASKIEGEIQQAMDTTFPAKIASSTEEHGAQIRILVDKSREEMEKESVRVVESISSKARAVADDEAKKSIVELVNNVIATAKGDFQVWSDGVLAGMRSSVIRDRRPVVAAAAAAAAVSGEESTSEGPNNNDSIIETEDCGVVKRCCQQQPTVLGEKGEWNNSDKENEQPDAEEETTLNEEVDDMETNYCSTVETQICADVQSGKWSDDDEEEEDIIDEKDEILEKGATPFSSKAPPSTTTTPFSRKTTPVKNNYGKNRKSMQSSRTTNDVDENDELKTEVQNDFGVAMSPQSKDVSSSKKKHTNGASPSSPQIPLKLSSGKKKRGNSPLPLSPRIGNRKPKSAKKAPKCESKHKIKAKPPTKQKPLRYSQASREESTQSSEVKVQQKNSNDLADKQPTKMKRKALKKTDTAPRLSQRSETKVGQSRKSESITQLSERPEKKQSESAPQNSQRSNKKRDQSIVNVEKSTRRSKRVKESTRAAKATKAALKTRTEQAALKTKNKKAKAAKAKQVTPFDDGERQLQSIGANKGPSNSISFFHNPSPSRSNVNDHLDTELHTYPENDVLLGTSIVVAETSAAGDDSSGLDPDDCLVDKPKEKLFTPFQTGGRRSKKKSYGRKSKTTIAMRTENNRPKKAESVFSFKW